MWRRLKQVLIAIDQLLNALLGGYADESLSSHCFRLEKEKGIAWPRRLIDGLLFLTRIIAEPATKASLSGVNFRQV